MNLLVSAVEPTEKLVRTVISQETMKQYLVILIIPAVFAWIDFDPYTDTAHNMQGLVDKDLCPAGNDSLCLVNVREAAYKYRNVTEKVDADCELQGS
ncbi:hypothetical protein WDU94_002321, partial [Cyamophila willieti]